LAYPKNFEFSINLAPQIIEKVPNALFVVIGEGPERTRYEKMIETNKLNNNFFLFGELAEAAKYLKAFDLFFSTSLYEGLSITLIEALGAGLPILASRVGGNQEIIPDYRQLYTSNDGVDFLKKMLNLLSNTRAEISQQNLTRAQKFNLEKMVEEYKKIIDSL
jgi:glycosyltransferase involved in cell wall biosynthesis